MKRALHKFSFFVVIGALFSACGASLFRPISSKETASALREETITLLNDGDYESAAVSAEKLWNKDKSNESASLFSISLASKAGVGLFDLIVNTIEKTSSSNNSSSSGAAGNNVFNALSSTLPSFTSAQLNDLKKSIEILDAAPNKSATSLSFQRCLTAAIYAVPMFKNLQAGITNTQTTLAGLPSKLGTGIGATCSASTETINATATELNSTISNLASSVADFSTALATISACFPSAQGKDSLNTVSQQVSKLLQNADKGCLIPSTQKIGSYTLPSCLNETVSAAGGASAKANDGTISGCELFLNCSAGSCF
ncbi:hypothetical protein EBU99_12595 [bacterium]|nr:hypothetical protein [bacterium]